MTPARLHTLIERAAEEQRRLSDSLVQDSPLPLSAPAALEAWRELQVREWARDTAHKDAVAGTLDRAACDELGGDTAPDALWAAARAAVFLGVLKGVILSESGAAEGGECGRACGVTAVCEGRLLEDVPVSSMNAAELCAAVEFLRSSHHTLKSDDTTWRYLLGLRRACALACVRVTVTEGSGGSLAALARGVDRGRAQSERLLLQSEPLFAGLVGDAGRWDRVFSRWPPSAGTVAPPGGSEESATNARLMRLIVLRSGEKSMQRETIQQRELFLSSVLCPYGREALKRRQLVSTARTRLVAVYDRLSYRTPQELLDEGGNLRAADDMPRGALLAAVWATVVCVMRNIGAGAEAWLQARASWGAWPGASGDFRAERRFGSVVDSEGVGHDNIVPFLCRALVRDPGLVPADLRGALESVKTGPEGEGYT